MTLWTVSELYLESRCGADASLLWMISNVDDPDGNVVLLTSDTAALPDQQPS
jgi:hypothetical protein